MRKKAKNILWSKLRGTPIADNIHSSDLLADFSSEWVMTFLTDDNDVTLDLSLSSVVIAIGNLLFR